MTAEVKTQFAGFPDFRANVTFTPIQFFTVVLPHCSRGTVRIVGYALRKVLGWVDEHGNPTRQQLQFTYRELIEKAGVSRDSIAAALQEALQCHCLKCVRSPRPDTLGQVAQSGVYELCWDTEGRYTDDPDAFRGFYYPDAVVVEERDGGRTIRRPKAARKNIPNAFFDHVLPRERLSVLRVVGALLFYSIQWGPGGERRVPVTCSISELSRLTGFSRHHTHEAVAEAGQRGYIKAVDAGRFDPAAGRESRPATYGIRWATNVGPGRVWQTATAVPAVGPVGKGERREQSATTPQPVEKGERHRSEQMNGKRSKKVNDIRIKTESKTGLTTGDPKAAAALSGYALLRQTGFDDRVAKQLAGKCSPEVIRRQIEWLPLRRTTRNRLGLLRRAIEGDWAKPEGQLEPKPNLSPALTTQGDAVLRQIQATRTAQQRKAHVEAQEARQAALRPEYLAYLRRAENEAQQTAPGLYASFLEQRRRTRQAMTGGLFNASAETLAKFDGEESRLLAFAECFQNHAQHPVLDFARWDKQRSLLPKTPQSVAEDRMPVRFPAQPVTEPDVGPAEVGARAPSAGP